MACNPRAAAAVAPSALVTGPSVAAAAWSALEKVPTAAAVAALALEMPPTDAVADGGVGASWHGRATAAATP